MMFLGFKIVTKIEISGIHKILYFRRFKIFKWLEHPFSSKSKEMKKRKRRRPIPIRSRK